MLPLLPLPGTPSHSPEGDWPGDGVGLELGEAWATQTTEVFLGTCQSSGIGN